MKRNLWAILFSVLTGCGTAPVLYTGEEDLLAVSGLTTSGAYGGSYESDKARPAIGILTSRPEPVVTIVPVMATAPYPVEVAAPKPVEPVTASPAVQVKPQPKPTAVVASIPMIVKSKDIVIVTDAEGKVSRTETIHEVTILEQLSAMWMSLASILGGLFATYTGYQKWRESRVVATPKVLLA